MIIKNIELENCRIIVWGTGKIAKIGFSLLKKMNIKVDFFCDNNFEKWGKVITENILCMSFQELSKDKKNFYFIMVGKDNEKEIIQQILSITDKFISFYSFLNTDIVYNYYFNNCESNIIYNTINMNYSDKEIKNIYNKKAVIYTCITGDYDEVLEPLLVDKDTFDYFIISDNKPAKMTIWNWIDAKEIIPSVIKDNVRRNRYCKINGYKIFSDYMYSIYIDGNIQIVGDLQWTLEALTQSGIALFTHPLHDCLYMEALICLAKEYGNEREIKSQIGKYTMEGMPHNYGQFECGFIVRQNNNMKCQEIMKMWWKEVQKFSYRDQISFMYCIWKNGLSKKDIRVLGENLRKSSCLKLVNIHHMISDSF